MREHIGKPQVLKEVNSSLIQQLIYEQGPISKPAIAQTSGLSLPTVNKIVDDLEQEGLILGTGLTEKGAGRKAMLYEANKNAGCLIALYYQRGHLRSRIADITGQTLYEEIFPLDTGSAILALDSVFKAVDTLVFKAPSDVKAIGVGVPGAVMSNGQLLGIPKIEVWEDFNLAQALADRYDLDICVENDVNLAAVGYYHTQLSNRFDNIVYIYTGNGMGSGIILNKKLYRGSSSFSGEIGFMAPLVDVPANRDYTASGGYLECMMMQQYIGVDANGLWKEVEPEQRDRLANIFSAAAANYIAILNPDAIVFGGELFNPDLVEIIKQKMSSYTPKSSMPEIIYDGCDHTGVDGLLLSCRGQIITNTQLISDSGV
jgi:Transcriptional regulator/sugar kinase